jgi:endonuclease YncB( thermonuclease family)
MFEVHVLSNQLKRVACALLIVVHMLPAAARDLIGRVSVVDGDTLDIHDDRIRLWGIDAPESAQLCRGRDRKPYRCGALAANTLDAFTRGKAVRCTPVDDDRYGRIVARCALGRTDLGQMLVSRGLAIEEPQYSHGRYAADQLAARRAGRGIWAGRFVEPSFYRACIHGQGRVAQCSGIPPMRR